MIEYEVKYKIPDGERSKIVAKILEMTGVNVDDKDPIYIDDDYFIAGPNKSVRVRNISYEGNRLSFLTVKIKDNNINDRKETEVKLLSCHSDNMKDALGFLGMEKKVNVYKIRHTTAFGNYAIHLDDVHHLGLFVEIEKCKMEEDPNTIKDLKKIGEILGLRKIETQSYEELMLIQMNKLEEKD